MGHESWSQIIGMYYSRSYNNFSFGVHGKTNIYKEAVRKMVPDWQSQSQLQA